MIKDVLNFYFPKSKNLEVKLYGHGHINDTYKVFVPDMPQSFILQRINTKVFQDPGGIIETHLKLQKSIRNESNPITIAELIPNSKGDFLTIDSDHNAWRLTTFIKDSFTIDVVDKDWQAFEAGKGYGWFANVCSKFEPSQFKEAIKDFHKLSFRINQLNEAIEQNRAGRLDSVKDLVLFYREREKLMNSIELLVAEGKIPTRVVHNDTKINNILFKGEKATAIIDLDTVGPGILFYDYGDALRTSASTAEEDEKDLNKVDFNLISFDAFTKGYLSQVKSIVTTEELDNFYLAPRLMTYIMGIRFLTDYLNGDTYYKTSYSNHNLDRSNVQRKLIESMENKEVEIKDLIRKTLEKI